MRVLQVSSGLAAQRPGGAELCCLGLTEWLASAGVNVVIGGAAGPSGERGLESFELHEVRSKALRKLCFDYFSPENSRRLRQIIERFAPDVVHIHNIYGLSSQLIRVASERVPTVVTLHDYWPVDYFVPAVVGGQLRYPARQAFLAPLVRLHRAIHRQHLSEATLVSPSHYLAGRLTAAFGYREIRVIPNGISLPGEKTSCEPVILFVGRLVPEKGLHEVLRPLCQVARELGWRIDVVGDGPLRAKLEQAFPSVWFHGRADPAPFYQRAGIVLVPSLWPENLGYVVLEAMSYEVPVLASNVGGIPEIVESGVTGRLYDPGDSQQFVTALRQLALDAELRKRLGRAARERITREFTWASIGPRYLALYEELASARPCPGAKAHVP